MVFMLSRFYCSLFLCHCYCSSVLYSCYIVNFISRINIGRHLGHKVEGHGYFGVLCEVVILFAYKGPAYVFDLYKANKNKKTKTNTAANWKSHQNWHKLSFFMKNLFLINILKDASIESLKLDFKRFSTKFNEGVCVININYIKWLPL